MPSYTVNLSDIDKKACDTFELGENSEKPYEELPEAD